MLITFDEFVQMREAEGEKLELVEGEVISMPLPVIEALQNRPRYSAPPH